MNSALPTGGRVVRELPTGSRGINKTKTVGFNFTAEWPAMAPSNMMSAQSSVDEVSLLPSQDGIGGRPLPRRYRRSSEYPLATGEASL